MFLCPTATKAVPDQVISGRWNATLQITCAGRLIDPLGNDLEPDGYITFYTSGSDSTWREYRARFLSGQLSVIVRVSKDSDDQVRYGLASYRWFDTPSLLFFDKPEDSGVESHGVPRLGASVSACEL